MSGPGERVEQPEPSGLHRTIFDHLGLPFYFRHRPHGALRRGAFWLTVLGIAGLFFINAVMMPSKQGGLLHSVRESVLFQDFGRYTTLEEGMKSLFTQCFCLVMVFSGIIAPLFSTFSMATERVSGTMEFLRLSPMSTTSLVLGKAFAPAYSLHLISLVLLAIGCLFGILADLSLVHLGIALLSVVCGTLTIHALGVFYASLTTTFKGFGAVLGLLMIGFLMYLLPATAAEERGLSFLAPLSPWGSMYGYFWRSDWVARRVGEAQIFGSQGLIAPFVLLTHGVLFTLLVYASVRKLDEPNRPALPKAAWFVLWAYVLLVCGGMASNVLTRRPYESWFFAAVSLFFGGGAVCLMALLDHPHSREATLTSECERLAGREEFSRQKRKSLWHAFFVSALVLITGLVIVHFFREGFELQKNTLSMMGNRTFPYMMALGVVAATLAFTFLAAVALEVVALRFFNASARFAVAVGALALLAASFLVPIIHFGNAYSHWSICINFAEGKIKYEQSVKAGKVNNQNNMGYYYGSGSWIYQNYNYALYAGTIHTLEDVKEHKARFEDRPLNIFWTYHRRSVFIYPAFLLFLATAFIGMRFWTYHLITREARFAVEEDGHPKDLPLQLDLPQKVDGIVPVVSTVAHPGESG